MDEPAASPGPEPATTPTPRPRRWRNEAGRDRERRRRAKAVGFSAAALIALGLVAVAGWLRPVARPALIVAGGPTSGIWSSPQWEGDREALAGLAGFEAGPVDLAVAEAVAAIGADARAGPLVVYISARGWIESADPEFDRPTLRLGGPDGPALGDLLRALSARKGPDKLLILDIHPPPDDPRAGALLADVAAVVAEESRGAVAADGRLAVLASCEPGQRPVASDAAGRSAFGYYVEQGLKGAADASGDGRVTSRELAAFARDRVARWAREARGVAQTPALRDDPGADGVALALAPRRGPAPLALGKEAAAYPDWLAKAWRDRDAWIAAGAGRDVPRPLAEFEAAILRAEREWRDGLDEAGARVDLGDRLDRLRERYAPTRAFPRPAPRSLALEEALGAVPDPEVYRLAREALARRPPPAAPDAKPGEREAAEAKLLADFHDPAKLKLRAEFDLAHAAFRLAADDPTPALDAVAFLDRLLAIRQPRPLYAETDALRRLSRLPAGVWNAEAAHRALLLARDGERADSRASAISPGLDEADRLRHEASVLLGAPGYAPAEEVNRRLKEARGAVDAALARSAALDEARRLAEDAVRILPAAASLLEVAPELERAWASAAGQVASISCEPAPGDDPAEPAEALRVALAPFGPRAIAARVARLSRPEPGPGPAEAREIEALLATPLPTAEGRLALWKAAIAAERRLVAATLALDARDGRAVRAPAADGGPGEGLIGRLAAGSTPRRARASKALLALAGSPVEESPNPLATARALAGRWSGLVEDSGGRPAADRDRAARLAPPWSPSPSIDDPASDPTRAFRSEEFGRLRRRLAARYAFEAADAGGSDFFAEAARDFEDPGDPPAAGSIRLGAAPPDVALDPGRPEATARLGFRQVGAPAPGPAGVEVSTAGGDWLDLGPGSPWPDGLAAPPRAGAGPIRFDLKVAPGPGVEVPLLLTLRPGPGPGPGGAAVPPGLVVRARLGSRTSHLLVPLRVEPASLRPRVTLTADPAGKGPDLGEVRLRAARGKTPFSLTLRNPGPRDRRLAVELRDRDRPIAGASATLAVKAGEAARVVFGPPPAKPEEGFVEVRGPLSIRLTDPDDPGAAAIDRPVAVGLARPSEYARVVRARFEPTGEGGRSRLEVRVRAVGPVDGPPCPVELSLPPGRIPGLASPGEGTYARELKKLGDEVALTVEGIAIDPREDEPGFLHLAVDGIARAAVLRGRLGRRGGPITLLEETRPAIRLRAGPSGLPSAPLAVGVDLDSPPEAGRVVVELGRYSGEGFQVDASAESGSGRGLVRLNPRGPDGALVFEATVRDPSVAIDPGRVRGRRLVRARLIDEREVVVAEADEVPVVLDDRPPGQAELVGVPKYGLKGGSVTLRAVGSAPESGLKEVAFFVGRPVDGKRPAGVAAVPGRPVDAGRTAWTATLPLGETKLGPADVSVEFVAGVGLGRFDTASLAVVEAIPAEPGKIRGVVKEGDRPQSGFEVRVLDDKGAKKGEATTDKEGKFEVGGLAPGTYDVVSVKLTPPTKGTAKAVVKPGETAEVPVGMFRNRGGN